MAVKIGDHQLAAWFEDPGHFGNSFRRVGGVVQIHIGKNGIEGLILGWKSLPLRQPEMNFLLSGEIFSGDGDHFPALIKADTFGHLILQSLQNKARPAADIGDDSLWRQLRLADSRIAHFRGEETAADRVPLPSHLGEVLFGIVYLTAPWVLSVPNYLAGFSAVTRALNILAGPPKLNEFDSSTCGLPLSVTEMFVKPAALIAPT